MDEKKVIKKMTTIFRAILDNPEIRLDSQTTAAGIPEWDSLSHILLVVEIEKFFKITFTALEVQNFKNVGEMARAISKKLK